MRCEERPHVEVLDAVRTVNKVQGRALAKSHADQAVGQSRIPGLPRKEVLAIRTRDPRQPHQIIAIYPLVGTAHTSTLRRGRSYHPERLIAES